MRCLLVLPLLGLVLTLAACGGRDPLAPAGDRAASGARGRPLPPPSLPDTLIVTPPVEPFPIEIEPVTAER